MDNLDKQIINLLEYLASDEGKDTLTKASKNFLKFAVEIEAEIDTLNLERKRKAEDPEGECPF